MDASGGPPPPPPPPPPGGGGGKGTPPMQLPTHLQAMMREVQMTLGGSQQHQQRDDQQLPMQFGSSNARGGRGFQQQQQQPYRPNNGGRGGRGGRGQRGGGRGGGRGFSGGRGGRGNGYGGRGGGGRGGFHNNQHHGQQQQHYGPTKRKRDFDGNSAAHFFLPSCLEDPWLRLLQPQAAPSMTVSTTPSSTTYTSQLPTDPGHHHQQHHQPPPPRHGRVLFQPSFLQDPWTAFVW